MQVKDQHFQERPKAKKKVACKRHESVNRFMYFAL
jgi:hypothetical protein